MNLLHLASRRVSFILKITSYIPAEKGGVMRYVTERTACLPQYPGGGKRGSIFRTSSKERQGHLLKRRGGGVKVLNHRKKGGKKIIIAAGQPLGWRNRSRERRQGLLVIGKKKKKLLGPNYEGGSKALQSEKKGNIDN